MTNQTEQVEQTSTYQPQLYETLRFEPQAAKAALYCNAIHADSKSRKITLGQIRDQGYVFKINTRDSVPESVSLESALQAEADALQGRKTVLMIDNKRIDRD